jgi:pimeloyl-ACP methyl ester carboxylesterase
MICARLRRGRWPPTVPGAGWEYGADAQYLQDLVWHWLHAFDWPQHEQRLNQLPQVILTVDGWPLHVIHARGHGPHPMPIILTHGWPGLFWELLPLLPHLIHPDDPRDAFDVVIPSLPGFGFSPPAPHPGLSPTPQLWAGLMRQLGYERFVAYGSDFGASVTTDLAWQFPDRVQAILLSTASDLAWPVPFPDQATLTDDERRFLRAWEDWDRAEGGYRHEQRTRPQTLAYGLTDSPLGLAAWIVEKLRAWSDCAGDIERRFSKDAVLTLVMLYWVSGSIASSMREYYERFHAPAPPPRAITVPTGVALFTRDFWMPRSWAERTYTITRWTEFAQGGHFPAYEEPQLLADECRAFFRPFRP